MARTAAKATPCPRACFKGAKCHDGAWNTLAKTPGGARPEYGTVPFLGLCETCGTLDENHRASSTHDMRQLFISPQPRDGP